MSAADLAKQFGGAPLADSLSKPSSTAALPAQAPRAPQTPSALASSMGGQELNSQDSGFSLGGAAKAVGNFFTGSTQQFGQTAGQSFAAPENASKYSDAMNSFTQVNNSLLKAIKAKQAVGGDITRLQEALHQHQQEAPSLNDFTGNVIDKSAEQVAGEALGTGLEALSGGALSGFGEAAKGASTLSKIGTASKIGAAYGSASGLSEGLKDNKDIGGVLGSTAVGGIGGAAVGGVLGAATSAVGKVANAAGKTAIVDNILPKTEARFAQREANVIKAREEIAKTYEKSLPLTPTQLAKEAMLKNKTGDNVFSTLSKYGINLGADNSMNQLHEVSNQFANATQHAQINEHAYFNLDEVMANAFSHVDQSVPSETGRITAKNKIQSELDALIAANKSKIQEGPAGQKLANSDLTERIRRIGNSWTNFNSSDPEKIGTSAGYALSNAVRDQVEKQGTFPAYREANKEWGKVLHAQEILKTIEDSGKSYRVLGGLSGSIARRVLSGVLGFHTGGLGGALLLEMGSEYGSKILSDPQVRTYFDRQVIRNFTDKKITPEIIAKLEQQVRDFIDTQASRLQLPAGDTSKIAIPMGAHYSPDANKVQVTTGPLPLGRGRVEMPQQRLNAPSADSAMFTNSVPINLPTSAYETNLGLNEIKNAKIENQSKRTPAPLRLNAAGQNPIQLPSSKSK